MISQRRWRKLQLRSSYFGSVCNLIDVLSASALIFVVWLLTLSKFFRRSMILPSTSVCVRPAGAEYHLNPGFCTIGEQRVDLIERQGAISREAGDRGEAASLVAHREERIRAVLIILKGGGRKLSDSKCLDDHDCGLRQEAPQTR